MLCCVSRKAAGGCGGVDEAAAAAAKDTMGPARCSVARFILDPMRRRNFKTVKSSGKNKRDQEADEEEERALKKLDDAVRGVAMVASTFGTFKGQSEQPLQATFAAQRVDDFADYYYDGRAESLEPCGVCGRKFNPRSLEKHMPICERTAAKKRKPFDSAKQRIKGTELAEFLPKQKSSSATLSSSTDHLSTSSTVHMGHSRRPSLPQVDDRPLPTSGSRENQPWRQKREEFIKAIRAARGEDSQPSSQPSSHRSNHHQHHQQQMQQRPSTLSLVSSHGAPQRANEKGQCPTCQRQFGVKSYDRHVAFCRERATRVPASPQVTNNVAKERLDARMKYRAPALKNRKLTMKEKYAPGGPHKVPQSPIMSRSALAAKEHKNEPKLPTLKRPSQTNKETPISSPATTPHSSSNNGPLKSRAIDRSNRGSNGDYNPFLLAEQQFNELFSESDQSSTDGSSQPRSTSQRPKPNSTPNSPFANSSAFVQYPPSSNGSVSSSSTRQVSPLPVAAPAPSSLQPTTSCVEPAILASADKAVAPPAPPRLSAPPPPPFDDLTSSDISGSDCTESTNSLTRSDRGGLSSTASSASRHLGRRMIIDPSQALGGGEFAPVELNNPPPVKNSPSSNGAAGNIISRLNRQAPIQQQQQQTNRSNSMRSISAPKPPERKLSSSSSSGSSEFSRKAPFAKPMRALPGHRTNNTPVQQHHTMNHRVYRNNYPKYSNGSLSSIIAPHESELKRSNSLFDDLLSSFDDDTANSCSTFPSLISMMRNDISSSMMLPSVSQQQQQQNGSHGLNGHQQQQQRSNNNGNGLNGSRINHSDEDDVELSSPESVKKQECNGKLSADSAYSSTNDVSGSFNNKCKLAVYCHQCGERFPDLAKFCCECGIKRLAL
ncbi:serine/arginine repetitive matrix protein 1 isoform X2 [Trichogramma pretiosum]|uniref:serine/arginine repetitive matrix protein 1 isoform X2 n=1 Tax=Trichogramma pretiosum TaxID=7493 RepID=UPI000C71AF6C|nr:serine/arginine repetitive matrix protein 1 isoform X2 [Trichogramma pretiosum]